MGFLNDLKFYFKSVIFGCLVFTSSLTALISLIFLKLTGNSKYAQYILARVFYFQFSKLLGVKVTIKNEHYLYQKPAIVISNHQTAADILVLGKVFKPGYTVTAKKALKYVPILGLFMLGSGTFFLDRSKGEKARETLNKALISLKKNDRALFIFPEGTRSGTTKLDLLPFKKGAFHLAKQAKIPIIPVAVSNYSNIFNAKSKTFNSGEIIVEVLPPQSTANLETNEDVTKFSIDIRDKIKEKIEALGYAKVSGQPSNKPHLVPEVSDPVQEDDSEVEIVSEGTPLVSKD